MPAAEVRESRGVEGVAVGGGEQSDAGGRLVTKRTLSATKGDCHEKKIWPTLGRRTAYAATLAETNGPAQGLAILDAIDPSSVLAYQPYWAVRAYLLQRLGKGPEAQQAYDRAIGLATDPAIKEFLLKKRG